MFEYAFGLMEEGACVRKAVSASMDAGMVTADISHGGVGYGTAQVGDWIAEYISRN